jgi:hypothetical protein
MTELDPRLPATEHGSPESAGTNGSAPGEPHRNRPADAREAPDKAHAPAPAPPGADGPPQQSDDHRDDRAGLDRAEEVVDQLAERVSSLTSAWGRKLLRLTSRASESVQDFWAEVQDFRHGRKP